MNTYDFMLPDVGEGLTEADILLWHVEVGDSVELDQTIVEIETAKSVVDLPSSERHGRRARCGGGRDHCRRGAADPPGGEECRRPD